ncbi:hypothetical protein [Marinicella litoralis]|nr:hypothetical protein [Marinicella litoralis]
MSAANQQLRPLTFIAAITVFAQQKKWWRRFWRAAVGERSESAAATI